MKLRTGRLMMVCGWAGLVVCFSACRTSPSGPDNAIKIGLLAAYTGDQSAEGADFEHALLILEKKSNDAGGVGGRSLRIVGADTHSDLDRGLEAARKLLAEPGLTAVVGPESPELVQAMAPLMAESHALVFLPGVLPGGLSGVDSGSFFRIGPRAEDMACSLAELLYRSGYRQVGVLHTDSLSDLAFVDGFTKALVSSTWNGASTVTPVLLAGIKTQRDDVWGLLPAHLEAIALATTTQSAAKVLADRPLSMQGAPVYLGPNVLNDQLLQNTPPRSLAGAVSAGPAVVDRVQQDAFDRLFGAETGAVPFPTAYYYYDALAVLALAMQAAIIANEVDFHAETLGKYVRQVTMSMGERTVWDGVEGGLASIRAGKNAKYYGLSGPMTFSASGQRDQSSASFRFDRVVDDKIVFYTYGACM